MVGSFSAMPPVPVGTGVGLLERIAQESCVVVTDGSSSDALRQALDLFHQCGEEPKVIDLSKETERSGNVQFLKDWTGRNEFPMMFVKGTCVGTVGSAKVLVERGFLQEWLRPHEYDLVVIGGGSGGLAAAKTAGELGKKVALLDFVAPTPLGTSWGLGGTCVNVGCIPKKLMHQAALLGQGLQDARKFGWDVPETVAHNWTEMTKAVQSYIGSLNWGYRVQLREKSVTYLNSFGSFVDSHNMKAVNKRSKEQFLSADRFLIAPGLRPRYIDIPGAKEYCITSDDLFSLPYCPGKTLLVGASYVSLECAGFLGGLGLDVTVMVRSILLRGFDQDMAERIGKHMASHGINFIRGAVPVSVNKVADGSPPTLDVVARTTDGEEISGQYNTVILAIGRDATTDGLELEKIGVKLNPKNKKLISVNEQSVSAPWVFGIGDVLDGKPELTPVAIQAGKLLSRRLFALSTEQCEYDKVPTTVFTPLEYGCCGYAEEAAEENFGKDNIEVFHNLFRPLEFAVPGRDENHCYAKLVCDKMDGMRVLGFHVLGPNAGEITQGFAIALKLGAKKSDFDRLIGIHPTCAETFTTLSVTKSSATELKTTGC